VKTLIVIPARYGSTRFPGKPLHQINGASMLVRTARVAMRAGEAAGARVIVATDDPLIRDHANAEGVEAVMTDSELPSGTDRALAAMHLIEPGADFIVNLQGDAPLTPVAHVAALIAHAHKADVVTPVVRLSWEALDNLRERKKITPFSGTTCVRGADGRAIWFSKTIQPAIRNEAKLRGQQEMSPVLQHIGLYGYKRQALERIAKLPLSHYEELEGLEQLRFLENGLSVYAVDVQPSPLPMSGVDTPEDAAHVEAMLAKHGDPHFS
jgi:3-deoxy-manno-octulosonate cytidylyltransferase (CMP-KDO synthetase)